MLLWDIIRDFFVQFVFGGYDSSNTFYSGFLGTILSDDSGSAVGSGEYLDSLFMPIGKVWSDNSGPGIFADGYICFGDWLSSTATIITLIGLFIGITMFIIKLVKWISNTIAMR